MKRLERQGKIENINKDIGNNLLGSSNFLVPTSKLQTSNSHLSHPTSHRSGITLIALVVTIVILLILAGITINLVLAEGGLFERAKEAEKAQEMAVIKDYVGLAQSELMIESTSPSNNYDRSESATDNLAMQIMKKNFPESMTLSNIDLDIENGEFSGSFMVQVKETGNEYKVTISNGKVTVENTVNNEGSEGEEEGTGESGSGETGGNEGEEETTVLAEGISVAPTTASLEIGETISLTAKVSPDNASDKTITWKSSNESVATVSSENGTSGTAITVTAIGEGEAIITATAKDGSGVSGSSTIEVKNAEPTVSGTSSTSHTVTTLNYSWEKMSEIAKVISDNFGTGANQVNKGTEEVTVSIDGESYTVGVGDTIALTDTSNNSYTVRILGFNHDKLANPKAYDSEETKSTVYAGISFEFVSFLNVNGSTTAVMNSGKTNTGGWRSSALRSTLNSEAVINSLGNIGIKEVEKRYISDYDDSSTVTTSNDKLWLLACSEIWDNGYGGTTTLGTYGYAIASESTVYDSSDSQTQYKYYEKNLGSTKYTANTDLLKKPTATSPVAWWLRSPGAETDWAFNAVSTSGHYAGINATYSRGVAPGFCI